MTLVLPPTADAKVVFTDDFGGRKRKKGRTTGILRV
jgi:hypothetical protein